MIPEKLCYHKAKKLSHAYTASQWYGLDQVEFEGVACKDFETFKSKLYPKTPLSYWVRRTGVTAVRCPYNGECDTNVIMPIKLFQIHLIERHKHEESLRDETLYTLVKLAIQKKDNLSNFSIKNNNVQKCRSDKNDF